MSTLKEARISTDRIGTDKNSVPYLLRLLICLVACSKSTRTSASTLGSTELYPPTPNHAGLSNLCSKRLDEQHQVTATKWGLIPWYITSFHGHTGPMGQDQWPNMTDLAFFQYVSTFPNLEYKLLPEYKLVPLGGQFQLKCNFWKRSENFNVFQVLAFSIN